ncbi:MAG: non-ribosomal peptide synthetase, partial [bacterium]
ELLRVGALPASVRAVCLAGEPLTTRLVRRIYQQQTIQKVFDLYGPSEDTTYSTFALRSSAGPATIGRPIANTRIYLLDSHLQPVPVGLAGEIYIGGDGLARGYFNRPELTAEKFIPNPFSPVLSEVEGDDPGARLYGTGDLARYLPDGDIEFLGRIDHQVKIRGFRIELGEIEAVLSRHHAVRETVVLAREMTDDGRPLTDAMRSAPGAMRDPSAPHNPQFSGKRLVAYVVPHRELSPSPTELRGFLKEKLPEYMIPSAFVMLDTLPLTPSGKVDRKALPAPDPSRPEQENLFVAPSTPEQKTIAEIWAQVLNVDRVGIHDNFFDLGGHSLLATQVISRLREAFSLELSLRSLFEAPTVSGLASVIEQAKKNGAESPGPKISPVSRHLRR